SSGGNLTLNANAATHFASSQHLAALTIGSGATANLVAGGARVLNLNGLTIAGTTNSWSGKLDLADNDLIVHASAGTVASVAATIANQVKAGINVGGTLWAGNGITTSLGGTGAGSYGALGVLLNDFASLG